LFRIVSSCGGKPGFNWTGDVGILFRIASKMTADVVPPNHFWVDYATAKPGQPFVSSSVLEAGGSFLEAMFASTKANGGLVGPLNPAELMASTRLRQIIEVLGDRFTHIVFDAPPLIGVSDSLILAPRLHGVVWCSAAGEPAGTPPSARSASGIGRARLLGVVLNDVHINEVARAPQVLRLWRRRTWGAARRT
jgi:hypothetical protein